MDLGDFEKAYHEAIAKVGDRSLRDVEPELAHTIAILERDRLGLISCGEDYRLFHERDSMNYLNPGRIVRVLLDRHYEVNGLATHKDKAEFLRNEITNKTRLGISVVAETQEQKQRCIECEWMKQIGQRKMPAMIRFDDIIKRGEWNETIEDAAYYAIMRC